MAKEPAEASPEDIFIREVDEEYRRDQLTSLWTRYGRGLLIVIGLALVALAAFLWWREEQVKQLGTLSEEFSAAQQGLVIGDTKAKSEIERFASGDFGGYTVLARFTEASRAAEDGNNVAALETYRALAADTGIPKSMRDLATVLAIRLEYDSLASEKIIAGLKPLAQPGAPWFGVAGEMLATAYMHNGQSNLAGPIFAAISADETIAPSLRTRAQQMAASIGSLPIPDPGADGAPITAPGAMQSPTPATETK